jgi:hypothetical protein
MATKELIRKRVLIGLGLSVFLFVVAKYVVGNIYKKKLSDKKSNFIGADGFYNADGGEGKFIAKRFDSTHRNSDGTLGATWISFNDSDIVGYWEKGKIEIGTEVSGLI